MNRLRLIKTAYTALAALMLTACASDELTDGTVQDLPEGKYPLQISSVTMSAESTAKPWGADAPQSRVTENTDGKSSEWNLNDVINVKLAGATETATFKVSKITTDAVTVTPINTVYWTKTTDDVAAWYSTPAYTTGTTVNLANQTSENGLAYVLGTTQKSVSHANSVSLDFSHQLAKVRVQLKGDKASEITAVKVKGFPSCTIDKTSGTVTKTGTETYLSTIANTYNGETYYEANLAPQDISTTDFIQLTDKKDATHNCSVSGVSTLDKAKYYVFNIEVKSAGPTEITGGTTITESGDYIIKGNITQGVTLNGNNINLTLEGVTANIDNAIKVTGGSPVIIVKGTANSFSGNGAGILISPNANVTIQGATANAADSKLTIKAGSSEQPGIGCADESSCNNITIKYVTLDVTGGSTVEGGAAIGTAGNYGSSVNDILIENANITATGGIGAAAIGFGTIIDPNYSINSIKIINSQLSVYVQYKKSQTEGYAAGIGFPYAAQSHTLTIKQPIEIESTETDPAKYFSSFKAMKDESIVSVEIRRVGKPMNAYSHSVFSWQGVKFNNATIGNDLGY